jgi:hypothetical protein
MNSSEDEHERVRIDRLNHLSQEEVDILTLETVDLLDGVELDHDMIIAAMHQDDMGHANSHDRLDSLWSDEFELNEVFEEAFVALQTPEPSIHSEFDWRDQALTQRLSDFTDSRLDPSQIDFDALLKPYPDRCFALDPKRDQPLSLIELSQMLIHTGQSHLVNDQLAPALLSANPLNSLLYLQSLAWIHSGEVDQGLTQMTRLLSKAESANTPETIKEMLIKLIVAVTYHVRSPIHTPEYTYDDTDQRAHWLQRLGELDHILEERVRQTVVSYLETLKITTHTGGLFK